MPRRKHVPAPPIRRGGPLEISAVKKIELVKLPKHRGSSVNRWVVKRGANEIGVMAECIDVGLDVAEAECPF